MAGGAALIYFDLQCNVDELCWGRCRIITRRINRERYIVYFFLERRDEKKERPVAPLLSLHLPGRFFYFFYF